MLDMSARRVPQSPASRPSTPLAPPSTDRCAPLSIEDSFLSTLTTSEMRMCRPHTPTYSDLRKVGEGAYGAVYKAIETATQTPVALKRILLHDPDHPELEGLTVTTLREISHLFNVSHPNVVQLKEVVYEAGTAPSSCNAIYMVLEYLEHDLTGIQQGLKERARRGRGPNYRGGAVFSISDIKAYMLQLLKGLAAMHRRSIIHRDLKTANLLVSRGGVLKIADFGLSRRLPSRPHPLTPRVCTLWYRPPELLLCGMHSYTYGEEVDIWSAGCIFAELLIGMPLFPEKDEVDMLYKICRTCGSPNPEEWPEVVRLPGWESCRKDLKQNRLKNHIISSTKERRKNMDREELAAVAEAADMICEMMAMTPSKRPTATKLFANAFLHESQPPPTQPWHLAGVDMDDAHVLKFETGANKDGADNNGPPHVGAGRGAPWGGQEPGRGPRDRVPAGRGGPAFQGRQGPGRGRMPGGPPRDGYHPYAPPPSQGYRPLGASHHVDGGAPDAAPHNAGAAWYGARPVLQQGGGVDGSGPRQRTDAHIQREIDRQRARRGRGRGGRR